MVRHCYIEVNSDEMKEVDFTGCLADFAAEKLSEFLQDCENFLRVISIESCFSKTHMQPVMCNSSTWYYREDLQLSVWYESR